jgi:beta-N-acetylhexosaminidase
MVNGQGKGKREEGSGAWRRSLVLALVLLGCATGSTSVVTTTQASSSVFPLPSSPWVDSVLSTLSLRDKAAQLVWPQLFGDYTPDDSPSWTRIETYIRDEHIGGVIMSVGSPIETAAKLNVMQRRSRLPLLVGADYENGAGFRTRGGHFLPNGINLGGATLFPPQMALGAARDSSLAYEQGRITAVEGRAIGVHVAFAPVLDVNNNPGNPVIGPRSFGEDPALVARLGIALTRGIQEHGMLATGKHFPGHGDTEQNSHLQITTVSVSRARLDSVELIPFQRAIRSGLGAIMTFHGVVPSLDTAPVPVTLSPFVMSELLRKQMGFQGLLVTDALDMTGVLAQVRPSPNARIEAAGSYGAVATVGLAEVVKQAVEAGADILLMPLDVPGAIDAVVAGVREKRFPESRIDASVRRILELKHRFGLDRNRFVSLDTLRAVVGDTTNNGVAQLIAQRSITLAKDSLRLVPLSSGRPRVLSISIANRNDIAAGLTFNADLRRGASALRTESVDPANPDVSISRLLAAADSAEVTVVSSYLAQGTLVSSTTAPNVVLDLVHQLARRTPKLVVVAFGNPYLLRQIPEVGSYLVAWGGFPVSQRAAAAALLGEAPITGVMPISIPPLVRFGDGEKRAKR